MLVLAADFDKTGWQDDARTFLGVCNEWGVAQRDDRIRENGYRGALHRAASCKHARARASAALLDQWRERLSVFLGIDLKAIGVIAGGKKSPTGALDIALLQSLSRKGEVPDFVGDYGHVIVDECHHLSAFRRCFDA